MKTLFTGILRAITQKTETFKRERNKRSKYYSALAD